MGAPAIDNYSRVLLGVCWSEFALALLLLLGRAYAGWRILHRISGDFYLTVLTFIIAVASHVCVLLSIYWGLGQHLLSVGLDAGVSVGKWVQLNQILVLASIGVGKLAIVAFLHNLHGPNDRIRMIFLWILAGSNLILNIIMIALILRGCNPSLTSYINGGCNAVIATLHVGYFQGGWSALCDLVLAIYPSTFFWSLSLKWSVKLGLCTLMGLGIITCICAIFKTIHLGDLTQDNFPDFTYIMSQMIIWASTEMWAVIIVGCIPANRPVFRLIYHKITGTPTTPSGSNDIEGQKAKSSSFLLLNSRSTGVETQISREGE